MPQDRAHEDLNQSWYEYRLLVISELESSDERIKKNSADIQALDTRLTILETKAMMIGSLAGLAGYVIPKAIEYFMK